MKNKNERLLIIIEKKMFNKFSKFRNVLRSRRDSIQQAVTKDLKKVSEEIIFERERRMSF